MTIAFPFLPVDRLHGLSRASAQGDALDGRASRVTGAALLADVWGFTVLADALASAFGPHRGAEELTRHLNLVYGALIGAVDRFGGSVLGFSGDAITCWFACARETKPGDEGEPIVEASRRAATCAMAMQEAVRAFARIEVPGMGAGAVSIAPKVAIAAGSARRFRVGDEKIQYFDALAGATLDRLAVTERRAARGEVLLEHDTARLLGDAIAVREWRAGTGGQEESAVIERVLKPAPASPWPPLAASEVTEAQLRPWLLPAVYERLVSGQGEFLAELRPAVAVFVRFGGIDYDADDDAGAKLDRYVRWVQGVLARYGGTLIDLTFGDKGSYFYAAFGAPTAHEDDAARALHAATELRELPADLRFLTPVQIGISRGRTRAGPIGGPSRRAYTVTGNEVNVAARLMQAAAPGEILVSEHVLEGERDAFTFRELPPMAIKGRTELVRAVALDGVTERTSQGPASDGTSMVGRERELALVCAKMERAARGSGQLVAITAEAGIGKSRLLADVLRAAKGRGFRDPFRRSAVVRDDRDVPRLARGLARGARRRGGTLAGRAAGRARGGAHADRSDAHPPLAAPGAGRGDRDPRQRAHPAVRSEAPQGLARRAPRDLPARVLGEGAHAGGDRGRALDGCALDRSARERRARDRGDVGPARRDVAPARRREKGDRPDRAPPPLHRAPPRRALAGGFGRLDHAGRARAARRRHAGGRALHRAPSRARAGRTRSWRRSSSSSFSTGGSARPKRSASKRRSSRRTSRARSSGGSTD